LEFNPFWEKESPPQEKLVGFSFGFGNFKLVNLKNLNTETFTQKRPNLIIPLGIGRTSNLPSYFSCPKIPGLLTSSLPFSLRKSYLWNTNIKWTTTEYEYIPPFVYGSDDWKLNINIDDLLDKNGTFTTNSNNIAITIKDENGSKIFLSYMEKELGAEVLL